MDGQTAKTAEILRTLFCASDMNIGISTATNKSDMLFFHVPVNLYNYKIQELPVLTHSITCAHSCPPMLFELYPYIKKLRNAYFSHEPNFGCIG